MSPVEIAAAVAAVALAATRLLKIAGPFWSKMPKPVQALLPVVVVALPQVASLAGFVHTDMDLTAFAIQAAALFVPGAVAHDATKAA
jgi:hypothetical protein